jgi:hypothetical protein
MATSAAETEQGMSPLFGGLPRHRQLIAYLETALDCLEEAVELTATLGVLPHWSEGQVRELAETLDGLLGRLEREGQHLAPLSDAEWGLDAAAEDDG